MVSYLQVKNAKELQRCLDIRHTVFTLEQGIAATSDKDGHDESAFHILAFSDSNPVGTGRVLKDQDGKGHIARIAVLVDHRRQGIAKRIIKELESMAQKEGITEVYLFPHYHLKHFYAGIGYIVSAQGDFFVDGHHLIKMEKHLQK